jgi:hypothetical protein
MRLVAVGHFRTHALQQTSHSFDQLVGAAEQRRQTKAKVLSVGFCR